MVPLFERLSLRRSTHQKYKQLLEHYKRFCADTGRDPAGAISETRLCEAAIYFCSQRSVNSLGNYISALQWWHKAGGFGSLPRGGLYERVRKGLFNVYSQFDKSQPAFALSLGNIYSTFFHLSFLSFEDSRNWCALLFGFFGLLRIGEYSASSPSAVKLRVKHVRIESDRTGIRLTIPFSKTETRPTTIFICRRPDILCPVAAMIHYLSFLPHRDPDEPFFTSSLSSRASLTPDAFCKWLKHQAVRIGLDPTRISGHSLRRGGTTAMFVAGVSETVIAKHGRWRSICYRRYFDQDSPHYLATSILLEHTSDRYRNPSSSSTSSLPPPLEHPDPLRLTWVIPSSTHGPSRSTVPNYPRAATDR